MPIDHTSIAVSADTYDAQLKLYIEALKPLGYEIRMQFPPHSTGFGAPDSDLPNGYQRADFWLRASDGAPNYKVHLAFTARNREQVDAFHAAALKNGGVDNGAPGLRTFYHANYYGAFFTDSAGNNIECVCHLDPQ